MAALSDTDQIKEKLDLVEFINAYVPLKKAGRNFKGSCPFHAEKDPSFFVSPERNFYYCFGCQKSGDIFTFLMEKEGLSFPEALKVLADKAGVKLSPRTDGGKAYQGKNRLIALSLAAAEYYHYLLLKHPVGGRAREYLGQRRITKESIEKFKLGYAPDSWDSTGQFLLARKYLEEELLESGLIVKKQKKPLRGRAWYDRFRGRIMFPIADSLGRVVGFSGRTLKKDPQVPKYINSPDSPIFHKGKLLYGLNLAKESLRTKDEAILVEGNLDVISTFQAGWKNVVAPLGTGFTREQAQLLKRFTKRCVILFDNDSAGERATLESVKIGLGLGLDVSVVQLSSAKDPDEAVRLSRQQFKADLSNPQPFFDYLLQKASQKFRLNEVTGKTMAAQFVLPFLALLPDQISKDGYVKKLAAHLRVEEKSVWQNLERVERGLVQPEGSVLKIRLDTASKKSRQELLGDYFISLLLGLPKTLWLDDRLSEILFNKAVSKFFVKDSQKKILTALTEGFLASRQINPVQIAQNLKDSLLQKKLDQLLLESSKYNVAGAVVWSQLERVLLELGSLYYKKELQKLSQALEKAQSKGETQKAAELRALIRQLNAKMQPAG